MERVLLVSTTLNLSLYLISRIAAGLWLAQYCCIHRTERCRATTNPIAVTDSSTTAYGH